VEKTQLFHSSGISERERYGMVIELEHGLLSTTSLYRKYVCMTAQTSEYGIRQHMYVRGPSFACPGLGDNASADMYKKNARRLIFQELA
jgi:hypothetical protein